MDRKGFDAQENGMEGLSISHGFFRLRAALAAAAAFFARAVRSSGLIVSKERLPPSFPPILPPRAPS